MTQKELLYTAIKASIEAGEEILKVYHNEDFQVEIKSDDSPLTIADKRANTIIENHLNKTQIFILSEEGENKEYKIRQNQNPLWIVDPLDGTKEFIKKNNEFTVNIALIENNKPILGVIYVPVYKKLYFGELNLGAYTINDIQLQNLTNLDNLLAHSEKLPNSTPKDSYVVVGSRSHMNDETLSFFKKLEKNHKNIEIVSRGSSLKICMVAEGSANIYPRYSPVMEWDVAAGFAIALASGCKVTKVDGITPIEFNKENLLNPYFIVER